MNPMRMKFIICFIVVLFSGCSRIVDWGRQSFDQGTLLGYDASTGSKYVRSIEILDQFSTVGKFDVLWLSDEVRAAYIDLHSLKFSQSDEKKNVALRRQNAENSHFIVFYVLVPFDISFGDRQSPWTLFLEVDGAHYDPSEIKAIEIEPEYKYFFGTRFNRFKTVYRVKFDAQDTDKHPIISDKTDEIILRFRSCQKEGVLVWRLL